MHLSVQFNWFQQILQIFEFLTHSSLASHKRSIGKQWRPRLNATECRFWSGSTLFALNTRISIKHDDNENYPDTPNSDIRLVQTVKVEESTRYKWVKNVGLSIHALIAEN